MHSSGASLSLSIMILIESEILKKLRMRAFPSSPTAPGYLQSRGQGLSLFGRPPPVRPAFATLFAFFGVFRVFGFPLNLSVNRLD